MKWIPTKEMRHAPFVANIFSEIEVCFKKMYLQQIETQLLVEIQGVETTALSKNSVD